MKNIRTFIRGRARLMTAVLVLVVGVAAAVVLASMAVAASTVGVVTTFAGTGVAGNSQLSTPALSATFSGPCGGSVDSLGNVYVADHENMDIRKITTTGTAILFAGSGDGTTGNTNGTGTAARFSSPLAIAIDSSNNLYVSDAANNRIRKVTSAAVVSYFSGSGTAGGSDGTSATATFRTPNQLCINAAGTFLYVADDANHTIRRVSLANGAVTTYAGLAGTAGTTNGATSTARFRNPRGIAIDSAGNVYVADSGNNKIRLITAAGVVSDFAGAAGQPAAGRANGATLTASFDAPRNLALDASGTTLYVADTGNNEIRAISGGVVWLLAGSTTGAAGRVNGTGSAATFDDPRGIWRDASGNLYVGEHTGGLDVRKIATVVQYQIVPSAGANGSISPTTTQVVEHGADSATFTITPAANYHVANVLVNGSSVGTPTSYKFTNVTTDGSITASFAINTYTLAYSAGAGGSLVGSATQVVAHGANGTTVTATPGIGYRFVKWSDDVMTAGRRDLNVTADKSVTAEFALDNATLTYTAGAGGSIVGSATQVVLIGSDGTEVTAVADANHHFVKWSDDVMTASRTDTAVAGNITVSAVFAIDTFTLHYSAGTGGSIVGSATQVVDYDTDGTEVTATPSLGYHFVKWSDNVMTAARTDTGVTADASVTAEFAVNTYTLTYSAGAGGAVVGSTVQVVEYGTDGTEVTAVPDEHYHFVKWSDDVMTASRTDTAVAGDITVSAVFAIDTYTLSYSAGSGGSIVGSATQVVDYNTDGTEVTAVADANHHFVKWSDDVMTASRTDTAVAGDITVTAEFAIDTFTLSYSAGSGGSIVGSATQVVDYNTDGTEVTATPSPGYHFVKWSDDVMTAARTDTGVIADKTVTAQFAIDTFTLSYTAGANGSIVGSATQVVDYDTSGTEVTATPSPGYHFVKWSDDVMTAARTDTGVTADKSVTAEFAINTYTLSYTAGTGGSIVGSATQLVEHGADGTEVTAVPDEHYHFLKWSDDVMTAARTDTGVTGAITVTAVFAPDTVTLTYSAGAGGSIVGSATQVIDYNTDGTTVTASPGLGYHFVKWSDDVMTAGRRDTGVTADTSVTAEFAVNTYTLTYAAGSNGSIVGSATQVVDYNTSGTEVTAVAEFGYHFVKWSDDVATAARTDANVTADVSVTAEFAIDVPPHSAEVTRVGGTDRYELAVNAAKLAFPAWRSTAGTVTTVIIACGSDRAAADPLCAAGLTGAANAPLLLVQNDTRVVVPAATRAALVQIAAARRGAKPAIIVVGGPASVTLGHWNALKPYASSMTRISGADRYVVAAGVATEIKRRRGALPFVLIAAGNTPTRFYEPLALGAVAAHNRVPVLLVKGSYVPPATTAVLKTLGVASANRYLGAHVSVVTTAAMNQLGVPANAAHRITGTNASRETFAVGVAQFAFGKGWLSPSNVGVTNKLADSLGGGTAMGVLGGPVLYTLAAGTPAVATTDFLVANKADIDRVYVIGGPASVPPATLSQIASLWP